MRFLVDMALSPGLADWLKDEELLKFVASDITAAMKET